MTVTNQDDLDKDAQQQDQQQAEQPKDGGLSPEQEFVLVQLASLDSRNDEMLADVLKNYPDLRVQILEYANANFGNTMVQKAMARVDGTFEAEQLEQMAQQDRDKAFMDQQIAEEAAQQQTTEMSTELKPEQAPAPAPEQAEQLDAVDTMKPGDEAMLAAALTAAPEIRDQVVEKATEELGPQTVEQAIEVQVEEQAAAPAEVQVAPEPIPEEAVAKIAEEPKSELKEEDWVVGAREYNSRHSELVDEFVQIAGSELRLPDGTVDPTVIVAWQQANGVSVDGRIGAETLAAAREGAKKVSVAEAVVAVKDETPADQAAAS